MSENYNRLLLGVEPSHADYKIMFFKSQSSKTPLGTLFDTGTTDFLTQLIYKKLKC